MSKILCITSGLTGITNASLELVSRLSKAGHEVSYACPRDRKVKVENLGISYFQLSEIADDPSPSLPDFKTFRKLRRILYKYQNRVNRRKLALKNIEPLDFNDLIAQGQFDLLIVDMELHEYIISAHDLKVPTVLLSQWFSIWRRKGLPYILTDKIPENSEQSFTAQWLWVKLKRKWTFAKKRILSAGTDRRSTLLSLAIEKNFPRKYIGKNYWPGPFLYNELPVMSMTAKELEFPHDYRADLHYVGPLVYKNRTEQVDEALKLAINKAKQNNQKIIYCSVSTLYAGDLDFLKKLIAVVEKNLYWLLIVGLGGKIDAKNFDNDSSNIILMDQVPQLYVLSNADCSINHGGIHTINECIVFGVPMLVYSGKRSDQNGCAARVDYHEIGIKADKDEDDEEIIKSKIHDILTNKKYLRNMEGLSIKCNNYIENKTIETIVHEYLSRKEKLT